MVLHPRGTYWPHCTCLLCTH